MNYLYIFIFIILGYLFNRSLSKDGHKINKWLPHVKIKFIQLSPNIRINVKNRTIHIHHWITYTIILIITLTFNAGVLDTLISKGFLIGGIIQGLSFPDWKHVVFKTKTL